MSSEPPTNPPGWPPPGDPGAEPPGSQPPYGQQPGYGQALYGQQPGYGQQQYGVPPYGQPMYGYGSQVDHPQGTTILVLGILGLVFCQILGPVAWVMGNSALREVDANPAAYRNRSNIVVGRILGIITSVLMILVVVFLVVLIAGGLLAGSSNSDFSSISG